MKQDNYYIIKGEKYARVTQICSVIERKEIQDWKKRIGEEEAKRISEEAAGYGDLVHEVTMWNDLNKVKKVEEMLKKWEWLVPHWIAWFDWVNEYVQRIHHVELVVWSKKLKCAGKIDRVLTIKGDKKPIIADIKTGNLYDEIGIQINGGYKLLYNEQHVPKIERSIVIHLPRKNPGHLQIKEYTNIKYQMKFKEAANLYHQINK